MTSDDELFLFVTGHGIKVETKGHPESTLYTIQLVDEKITEEDIGKYLKQLKLDRATMFFEQCHGGRYSRRFGKGMYLAISSCGPEESSYDVSFGNKFFWAFRDPKADINHDGRVSIGEAYKFALENDENHKNGLEQPELHSQIDPEKIFLSR